MAETLEAGASVSVVARRHDLNANQLFTWRRQFAVRMPEPRLLPVEIGPEPALSATRAGPAAARPLDGSIEIGVSGGVRVLIKVPSIRRRSPRLLRR